MTYQVSWLKSTLLLINKHLKESTTLINTELYPDDNVPRKVFIPAQPSDLSQLTEGDDNYASASEGSTPTEELTYPSHPITPTQTSEMLKTPPAP